MVEATGKMMVVTKDWLKVIMKERQMTEKMDEMMVEN